VPSQKDTQDIIAQAAREAVHEPPAQETRGRPADRPYADDIDPSLLTRSPRTDGGANLLEIPATLVDREWDYQWITIKVLNQEVDPSEIVAAYAQGWRPVEAKGRWLKEMCPPGFTGRTIDSFGQRLFCRPMRLTQEARKEAEDHARRMRREKLEQAMASPEGTVPRGTVQLEAGLPERIPSEKLDSRRVSI